jgi:hypothetical protein
MKEVYVGMKLIVLSWLLLIVLTLEKFIGHNLYIVVITSATAIFFYYYFKYI